ncbi:hypothetical protein, variant [Aphanomyces astaci]|uniref:COMM domain-containing protein 5 n=1 Tax=Aphanomyces astaci TaxID=112090 RepID=W4H9A5_APHAT|nr:hypothetical protein H257_00146 [Aphanomyces astaci]XP_009820996.1 hypothetical protein, variant [Aphanomyces astaci]ETV88595.1 hypothetical protein H257_00146 [Aphanomyces astaci]ETV88596.1 hypothetical protein, variant [Aphanomyces astaci]|eukprot:XP_009820995.1 hypothetical protein H257_00146 [Aphanomyces astaci]
MLYSDIVQKILLPKPKQSMSFAVELVHAVNGLAESLAAHPQVDACAVLSVLSHTYHHASGSATDPAIEAVTAASRAVLSCLLSGPSSSNDSVLRQSALPPRVVSSISDTTSILADAAVSRAIPRLNRLDWRVDINVASSALESIYQPSVVLRMQLSNGRQHTVELSLAKFHELRYNTAKILQEMNQLERHPILRLTREGLTTTSST